MIWLLCVFTFFLSSCEQKSQERHYTEIVVQAPQVLWQVPQGWKQEPGDGMRLATFHLISNPADIDCSIVLLGPIAGGLDANLGRWLGQLGLPSSDDNLKTLSTSVQILKTKDGLAIKVFDFTTLQNQGLPSDKSMMTAMMDMDQTTVFIKMMGSIETVKKNKEKFLKLLGSMTRD